MVTPYREVSGEEDFENVIPSREEVRNMKE